MSRKRRDPVTHWRSLTSHKVLPKSRGRIFGGVRWAGVVMLNRFVHDPTITDSRFKLAILLVLWLFSDQTAHSGYLDLVFITLRTKIHQLISVKCHSHRNTDREVSLGRSSAVSRCEAVSTSLSLWIHCADWNCASSMVHAQWSRTLSLWCNRTSWITFLHITYYFSYVATLKITFIYVSHQIYRITSSCSIYTMETPWQCGTKYN